MTARAFGREAAIAAGCLAALGLLVMVMPILLLFWVSVGSLLLWPLVGHVQESARTFYLLWGSYLLLTVLVFYGTVRFLLRRFGV